MTKSPSAGLEREPSDDERLGMAWWNALSEQDRSRWLTLADSAVAADAWAAYKAQAIKKS